MSADPSQPLGRLEDWIKRHSDTERPFRPCPVVDTFNWQVDGPSFVTVLWEGTARQAIYRDGPRPLDGQILQVIQMNHKPNSALLALPLPQQYRKRLPFLFVLYDTSGLVSPNTDSWSIVAGRKDNGHWVKRSDNPVTASVFSAFGAGSRFNMKMRAEVAADLYDDPDGPFAISIGNQIVWGYPDFQGSETAIANVPNAFVTRDDGLTWEDFPTTGLVDLVPSGFMLAHGGSGFWAIASGIRPGVGISTTDPGFYQISGVPTALRILNGIRWNNTDPAQDDLYQIICNHSQYWVVYLRKPSIVQPAPEDNQWHVEDVLGPFGFPGGSTLCDLIEYRGFSDSAGPGIDSSLTGSFVVWRMGPNKQTYRAYWNQLIAGGGWSSYTGTAVPAEVDPVWTVPGDVITYMHAVNPTAPWVGYHSAPGSAPPLINPQRMVGGTEQAFRSRDAPGEYAPFFSQYGLGNFSFTEQYIKPDLTVARSIRTAYAIVGPSLRAGGRWDYDFPNGARGPKIIAAINDQVLGGYTIVEDSEYMDEDLGNRYALWPFSRMSHTTTLDLDWHEGFAAGELG